MKPKTKRILTLVIAMAVVSPLNLYYTALIALPALTGLLVGLDEEDENVEYH